MPPAPLSARLTIDLDALAQNYAAICKTAATATVAPVVKADGYGLGAVAVSRRLWTAGRGGRSVTGHSAFLRAYAINTRSAIATAICDHRACELLRASEAHLSVSRAGGRPCLQNGEFKPRRGVAI